MTTEYRWLVHSAIKGYFPMTEFSFCYFCARSQSCTILQLKFYEDLLWAILHELMIKFVQLWDLGQKCQLNSITGNESFVAEFYVLINSVANVLRKQVNDNELSLFLLPKSTKWAQCSFRLFWLISVQLHFVWGTDYNITCILQSHELRRTTFEPFWSLGQNLVFFRYRFFTLITRIGLS